MVDEPEGNPVRERKPLEDIVDRYERGNEEDRFDCVVEVWGDSQYIRALFQYAIDLRKEA